jgi:hypothetical protein
MSDFTSDLTYFQVGGSLAYQHPTYVMRQADVDLYQSLKRGEFCYVLNARQMGKSSLRVQVMKKLKQAGIRCASIDLTRIGTQATPLEWYGSLVSELIRGFGLHLNFSPWWQQQESLSAMQRFNRFLEDILLRSFNTNIVIFLDEIDSILNLPFKDDFFALIRACYNQRSDNPDYQRLTFCLLGATTPSNLIQDQQRTPFNIGRAIELTGFQLAEAQAAFSKGLSTTIAHPETTIAAVFSWTNGQPFLTQKICQLIAEHAADPTIDVDQLVQTYIIDQWQTQDEPEHLRTICDRLLHSEKSAVQVLALYQQILENGCCIADESFAQVALRLSGIVVKQGNQIQVQNRIYATVFNCDWIEQELNHLRLYATAISAWITSGGNDKKALLQGQPLRDALNWSEGKTLSDQDYQFLSASQAQENELLNRIVWELISPLSMTDVSPQVAQLLKRLQQVSDDPSLALLSIEAGSTILTFQGTQSGFLRIRRLLEAGQLSILLNVPVHSIQQRQSESYSPLATSDFTIVSTATQQILRTQNWLYWVMWFGTAIATGIASFILLDPILDSL